MCLYVTSSKTCICLELVLSNLLVSRLAYGLPLLSEIGEGSPVQKAEEHLPETVHVFEFQSQS